MPPPQRWHARILPRTSVNGLFPFPKFAPPSILRSSTGLASTPRPSSTSARASRSLVPSGKPTLNLRTAWGGDLHLFRTSVCLNSFAMNLPLTATSQHIINHSLNPCCRTPTLFSHPPSPKSSGWPLRNLLAYFWSLYATQDPHLRSLLVRL